MTYRYEIDENNAVRIWESGAELPFAFQPDWPDGTPWANKAEAENWAKQLILSRTDETVDLPGSSPSYPTEPRPINHRAMAYQKLIGLGLTAEEISAITGN